MEARSCSELQVFENGGKVLGIIPGALIPREVSGGSVGDVVVVKDMHERKARMAKEADAFIAMPGRSLALTHLHWGSGILRLNCIFCAFRHPCMP